MKILSSQIYKKEKKYIRKNRGPPKHYDLEPRIVGRVPAFTQISTSKHMPFETEGRQANAKFLSSKLREEDFKTGKHMPFWCPFLGPHLATHHSNSGV